MAADAGAPAALPIEVAGRVLGAYAWVEHRLFEVAGGFAATEPEPEAAIFFDVQSRRHAWHAELFAGLLPVLPGVDHGTLVSPPGLELETAMASLAELPGAAARLAVLSRLLLPRIVAGYRRHLELAAPVADGPATRALGLVVADEREAVRLGEDVLEHLARHDARASADAAAALAGIEALLPPGTARGLVAWPGAAPGGGAGDAGSQVGRA